MITLKIHAVKNMMWLLPGLSMCARMCPSECVCDKIKDTQNI